MVSAFVSIPMALTAYRVEQSGGITSAILLTVMQFIGTILFAAVTLFLKNLLNRTFRFDTADRSIMLMIAANIISGVAGTGGLFLPQMRDTAGVVSLIFLVFAGMMQVRFAFLLFRLPDNLNGMLRPYCWLNIITGISSASLILIIFGIVTSAVADVMLATIFFTVAGQKDSLPDQETGEHP